MLGRAPPVPGYFSSGVQFVQSELGLNFDYLPVFDGADNFIHAALDHKQWLYAGGEGNDPKSFAFKNLGGTAAMLKQAKKAGLARAVFLSDQLVYGAQDGGDHFYETDDPKPGNIYAKVKHETEKLLSAMNTSKFGTVSLRLSHVYGPAGPGRRNKWDGLFKGYLTGRPIAPKAGCEIHGEDVARAVRQIVNAEHIRVAGGIFNAMDAVIDRRDILEPLRKATSCPHDLPERSDRDVVSTMNCDKLKRLEWRTGGLVKLSTTLDHMLRHM